MIQHYEDFLIYSGQHYSVYFHADAEDSSDVYNYFECFFFAGKKIIITSAYTKKRQKLDRNELRKAIQIRKQYFNE